MTLDPARRESRRRSVALAILAAGFATAFVIFVAAAPPPARPGGDEPEDSKKYLREMEVYGGKSNMLASAFRQWLESLWHGRRLAYTVAGLTLLAELFYLVASTPLPQPAAPPAAAPRDPDRTER